MTHSFPSNFTGKHETCVMYDYNYTAAAEIGYDAAMANRPSLEVSDKSIGCTSRDFNRTQYQSTVVTEVSSGVLRAPS